MARKLLLPVAGSLLLLLACSRKEAKEEEAVAPVQVASAQKATVRRIVEADAVLSPFDQSSVMPKISAPVQRFMVNRGDRVRAGMLVAVLENRDLVAAEAAAKGQVDQARANLASTENAMVPESVVKAQSDVQSAQEQYDAARKALDNRQKLFQEGALAHKLVDDAAVVFAQAKALLETAQEHLRTLQTVGKQEQINTARAQLASAEAQYRSTSAQVSYSQIKSPIDGVVSDRPVYAGEMASAGAPLLTVMDVSRVIAKANVPQSQASAIRVGNVATLKVTNGETELPARVTVVSPAADPASTTIQVWVQADNPAGVLKPGASVRVRIVTATIKDATTVPVSALLAGDEGGTVVLVLASDSSAHRNKVEVGVRDGDQVQLLNGVVPGDQVVTAGGVGVDDKAKVRVVKAGDKDEKEE